MARIISVRLLEGLWMVFLLMASIDAFDVADLCNGVSCPAGEVCRAVKACEICLTKAECVVEASIPSGIDYTCLDNAFLRTVFVGDADAPGSLDRDHCNPSLGPLLDGCEHNSVCVRDGSGHGVCCYQDLDCQETLRRLFQSSFVYNGRTYLLSSLRSVDSQTSEIICEAAGGYLAEITTSAENDAVQGWLLGEDLGDEIGAMIGGTDAVTEDTWVTQFTGTTLTFFDWEVSPSQPDGTGDCLHMIERSDFEWDDIPCDFQPVRFVCEIPNI